MNNFEKNGDLFKNKKLLAPLIKNLHPALVINDTRLDNLENIPSSLDFYVAVRKLNLSQTKTAEIILDRVSKGSIHYAQSRLLRGLLHYQSNNYLAALKAFKVCAKYSQRLKETTLYRSLRNKCIIYASRVYFTKKKYGKSLAYLDLIKKRDYLWPRTLLDRAWAYYWNKDYGQTLGSLVTYKAPITERFILPEVFYLRSLVYYKLCYFDKSKRIYNQFEERIKFYENSMLKYIKGNNSLEVYRNPQEYGFAHDFFKGFKKEFKYLSFNSAKKNIRVEREKLKMIFKKYKNKNSPIAKIVLDIQKPFNLALKSFLDHYTEYHRQLAQNYLRQISITKKNMVKLKLLLGSNTRKASREGKTTKNFKKNRLSLYEIEGSNDKAIYEFIGGFWADEIGDYSFALQSACKEQI